MTASITAAPVYIEFGDGSQFRFFPLSDRDYEELDNWLRQRVMKIALESLPDGVSSDKRRAVLDSATTVACTISSSTELGTRMLSTVAGASFLCWISIRRDSKVSIDELTTIISDPDHIINNVKAIIDKFAEVNYAKKKGEDNGSKKAKPIYRVKK